MMLAQYFEKLESVTITEITDSSDPCLTTVDMKLHADTIRAMSSHGSPLTQADARTRRRRTKAVYGRLVTQAEVADALGCSRKSYIDYENGKADLPWGLTDADVDAALDRLVEEWQEERAG